MSFESHHEVSRSTPERGISQSAFQNERLGEGRNFECNLSAATDKLAKDGVLPQVEIDGGSGRTRADSERSDGPRIWDRPEVEPPRDRSSGSDRPNIFDKFDGDKNGKVSGKEWSTKFDNLAGEDQSARLEDFQKEFGDNGRTKRFFDRADQDHDSKVSAGEFLGTFERAESNGNKDEYLGRDEFREVVRRQSSIDWNSPGNGDGDQDQSTAFANLDANKNDQVSASEWINKFDGVAGDAQRAGSKELEAALGKGNDAANLLKLADTNGDKNIDVMEWMRLFEKLEKNGDFTLGKNEFPDKPGFPPIGGGSPVEEPPPKFPVPPIELPPSDKPHSPYQPSPPINTPRQPEQPAPPVLRPGGGGGGGTGGDRPSAPIDQPSRPATPTDNGGEVPRATPQQVETLFSRTENRGASDRYMQEVKQALAGLPASVVQAAIDGGTRIIANGQGPRGLGGTYNSGTNSINLYETSPFNTKATLAAEMFHNWDLNPRVGKHITSQPWFQDAFRRARASGINTGDNTLTNPFEFIHHMARYYSGFTGGTDGQLMNFLGADYRARTRQALLS